MLLATSAALGGVSPALAWTAKTELEIAELARRVTPPDLSRQLLKHRDSYRHGVLTAAADPDRRRHVQNPDGSGQLQAVVRVETNAAIQALRGFQAFDDVAFRLGVVAHYVAALNDPLALSDADPREPRFAADFGRYTESATPRMAVVFYGRDPLLDQRGGLELFARASLLRSRGFYPAIGREYSRIGYAAGTGRFDDRSTAFGVAALSVSHAVTDVALVLRHVWLAAGGGDDRPQLLAAGRMFRVPSG